MCEEQYFALMIKRCPTNFLYLLAILSVTFVKKLTKIENK